MRTLTAIPVYNEARHVRDVLAQVRKYSPDVLVIDDGSTDDTAGLLAAEPALHRVTHPRNRGYGAAIASAFRYAIDHDFDLLVTTDCDGQHEPARIPVLLEAVHDADIVSGSRYLRDFRQDTPAPTDRRSINMTITREVNARYGLDLTDTFCGFKAYRVDALRRLNITEAGWGMPLNSGSRRPGSACGSRRSASPGCTSTRTGRSAGCSTTRASGWPTTAASSAPPRPTRCRRCQCRPGVTGSSAPRSADAGEPRPTADRAVLADPPRDQWPRLAEANRRRLDAADVPIGGMPLRELRGLARSEVISDAQSQSPGTDSAPGHDAPLVLSGHQPELCHPGVWVKNFA